MYPLTGIKANGRVNLKVDWRSILSRPSKKLKKLKIASGIKKSEFLNDLSDKGFYVANESVSNYLKTRSSLASSLNMEYINYLTEQYGEEYQDLAPIYHLMQDYSVWRLLKSARYEFIHFGSWWEPTRENIYADKNIR